jgi:Zn-dependent peptidase ImmA (M78 family)/transcriptional regulator with XRE-family HTH domain
VATSIRALVSPGVLRWARESINLTTLAASRKLGFSEDRVLQWEQADVQPSIAQIRKAATVYKRPLGVFFLSEPPRDFDAMRDFRRHVGQSADVWSPELHAEYRRAQTQRENAMEVFELDEESPPTQWRMDDLPPDNEQLAAIARAKLLTHADVPLPPHGGTAYDHLNTWVSALEDVGVLVMATARGGVSTQEMRAFSLYFDELPVIVVNGADGPRARLFSLLHEYVHLLMHTAGLCDVETDPRATTPDRELEARCNAIAAAILMPAGEVLATPQVISMRDQPEGWTYDDLRRAASAFGVSAEAFLRRLLTLGRTTTRFYQRMRASFQEAYEAEEQRTSGGGNWYRNTARDLGKGYVRLIADARERRVIDSYTAASFLNVKVAQIPRLAREASAQASA